MNRRREWILLAASVVISIVGILISRGERPSEQAGVAVREERRSADEPRATPSGDPGLENFRAVWPRPAQVREEVREDPHQVPPSLLEFARALGAQLERAHSDSEFSLQLLSSLEDCVRSTEVIESARAVCLRHSRRIPGFHPEDTRLPIAAARVHEAAPKRVLEIAEAVGS
jgi:hypothetical protein